MTHAILVKIQLQRDVSLVVPMIIEHYPVRQHQVPVLAKHIIMIPMLPFAWV